MNLTALLISIGVVVAACVLYWWLERTFDITLEDIAGVFIGVICFAVAAGMIYMFICPVEDLENARDVVYEITSDNQDEKQSECPLFGDSCVVDEWGFECLFTKCIVDTRK